MKANDKKSVRLPNHISPVHYSLSIKPDLESFTFSGSEKIKIKILKGSNEITLHSKDLDIETAKYKSDKLEVFADKISYDIKKETATFHFKNKIKKGNGELSIIFSGVISESLRGFYRSKYTFDGKDKFIATTQFEATDARRAFPCFDEPAHKAVFELSLIIKNEHTAISNTLPINIREHESGYKIVSFSPSPKMSTYLLAFIVGEFEYIEGYAKKNSTSVNKFSGPWMREDEGPDHENSFTDSEFTKIRVYTTPGKTHQAKFALDVAIRSLDFYNDYFAIPYPLPTLDLIALPDFESGAMENWGAVTFRETALLVDEENSSLSNKQWVALVIAHELAHQWFGNLVTMHWWTDLWLNEGFASYIEYLAIDKIFPNWKIWNHFLTLDHNIALSLDSLNNSHPIEIEVHHPNEINEIFDKISYSKGASIIRMLALYLGENDFRDGLRYYLKKHSYKNTKTINLWEAFEKVSGKKVKKMMNSWTKQTGYPLVEMKKSGLGATLCQERFYSSRKQKDKNKTFWQIPISYSYTKNEKENVDQIFLEKKSLKINNKPEKLNKDETSFIRVKYDKETLDNIKKEITGGRMSVIDRLGIIRDTFALAESGHIKASEAMELSLVYKNEDEFIVWSEIASGINKIKNIISKEKFSSKYNKYILSLFSPLARQMGFEKKLGEDHSAIFLRNLAISMAGSYGDKDVINKSKKIFSNKILKPIEADIRGAIYGVIASNGGAKEWKEFERMYKKENMHEEKDRIGRAMMMLRNQKEIKNNLSFIMTKNIRNQDFPHMLAILWQNVYARDDIWKFIKKNCKYILKNYGEGGHFLSRVLPSLVNHTDLKTLKDAKKFFKKNSAPGAERTLEQAYERIVSNAAWIRDDKKIIKNWLEKNY